MPRTFYADERVGDGCRFLAGNGRERERRRKRRELERRRVEEGKKLIDAETSGAGRQYGVDLATIPYETVRLLLFYPNGV